MERFLSFPTGPQGSVPRPGPGSKGFTRQRAPISGNRRFLYWNSIGHPIRIAAFANPSKGSMSSEGSTAKNILFLQQVCGICLFRVTMHPDGLVVAIHAKCMMARGKTAVCRA